MSQRICRFNLTEAYLEPCQTTLRYFFCENSEHLKAFNYLHKKKIGLRCLTEFSISLCLVHIVYRKEFKVLKFMD